MFIYTLFLLELLVFFLLRIVLYSKIVFDSIKEAKTEVDKLAIFAKNADSSIKNLDIYIKSNPEKRNQKLLSFRDKAITYLSSDTVSKAETVSQRATEAVDRAFEYYEKIQNIIKDAEEAEAAALEKQKAQEDAAFELALRSKLVKKKDAQAAEAAQAAEGAEEAEGAEGAEEAPTTGRKRKQNNRNQNNNNNRSSKYVGGSSKISRKINRKLSKKTRKNKKLSFTKT